MRDHLSSLFQATAAQARAPQSAGRAVGRERAAQVSARQDAPRAEFSLPPEPQERRGLERSRRRADETPARPETRGADSARETAPRRQDPPRRTDPPRRAERDDQPSPAKRPRCDDAGPNRPDEAVQDEAAAPQAEAGDATGLAETEAQADTETGEQSEDGDGEAAGPAATPTVAPTLPELTALAPVPAETTLPQSAAAETTLVDVGPDLGAIDAPAADAGMPQAAPQAVVPEATAPAPAESLAGDTALPAHAAPETTLPVSAPSETSLSQAGTDQGEPSAQESPAAGAAVGSATTLDQAVSAPFGEAVPEAPSEAPTADGFEASAAANGAAPAQPLQEPASAQRAARAEPNVQALDSVGRPEHASGLALAHGAEHGVKSETPGSAASPRAEAVRSENSVSARAAAGPEQLAHAGPQSTPSPSPSMTPNFAAHLASGAADPSAVPLNQKPESPVPIVSEVPLKAVPIEIGLKSLAGVNRFEIRLDPAELGRIEVSLEIDDTGEVKAHLTVDKVETLALLQRDARTLERAFEQAGLKSSDGGVNLSLRDQQQGHGQQGQSGDGREGSRTARSEATRDHRDAAAAPPRRFWRGTTGVDVRV